MKILDWIKNNLWAVVVAVLFFLFKYEQKKSNDANAELINKDVEEKDAVLVEKQTEVEKQIDQEKQKAQEEESKKLPPDEMADFLKKV